MKPTGCSSHGSFFTDQLRQSACFLLAAAGVLSGCATGSRSDNGSVVRAGHILNDHQRAGLGIVGMVTPSAPALVGFDQSRGQIDYPADRAGLVAREILSFQPIGHPQADAIVAVGDAVAAPFAAATAAVSAHKRQLPGEKLAGCQERVGEALRESAEQQKFTERLMQVSAESGRRKLVPLNGSQIAGRGVDTIFEPQIEQVRLERIGKSDASFALRVKARARLIDAATTNVIYDEPFEYLSGTALFVDWSLDQVIQDVTETARNELGSSIVEHLFSSPLEGPILLGAGFRHPAQNGKPAIELAANTGGDRNYDGSSTLHPGALQSTLPNAKLFAADFHFSNTGAIGIYSTSTLAHITIQQPLTKDEAVIEALQDLKYDFDEIDEFPNIVVQLGAAAAAIPISLYRQTAAAFQGVTAKKLAKAEAAMTAAVRESRPHEEVARQVVQWLAPQSAQQITLVKQAWPSGQQDEVEAMQWLAHGTLVGLSRSQRANDYLVSQGADSAMEIEITKASLEGKEGINAPVALCVEARALLFRSEDGTPFYSKPVKYRSAEHKFTDWGDNDARLFRAEIAKCYEQMGGAIAGDVIARHIVPGRTRRANEIARQ